MAERLNPGEETAAEADYKRKFNRTAEGESAKNDLKAKEAAGSDASWKTTTKKKQAVTADKKGRFNFRGRNAGKLHHASAFAFIIGVFVLGVAYTSLFAPNIMMVNIKEMYTNDLADSTIALDAYAKKLMNYRLGHSNCGDKESIKCKLSTMPRGRVKPGSRVSP